MRRSVVLHTIIVATACAATHGAAGPPLAEVARARTDDLRFGVYATARQVEQLATDKGVRARARSAIETMGITKVCVEVYRSGHVVPQAHLILVRDWLRDHDIAVVGGIATVPGAHFGVRQQGPLGWFNWQDPKTQHDVREVIRSAAAIFDTLVVDDFFCTADQSAQSSVAKGDRSWGEYRRALLSELARRVIVGPAKAINPTITMIVKYPQWYDRFHLFGYDTQTLPQIFDRVWVGTETRGRTTQRFGFVQPYEGFVNYRWLADIAPRKIGSAWFDHGDCREGDFLDQAYMSVLAGARELIFFNLGDLMAGHPDHPQVAAQFNRLADLAAALRTQPVTGIPAYKPPNSDPAGDMYLLDFLGMLGIPLVPVHTFPESAAVIFLPAQAAADPQLLAHVRKARGRGATIVVTASLLSIAPDADQLARLAGLDQKLHSRPLRAQLLSLSPESRQRQLTDVSIDLEAPLKIDAGPDDILCATGDTRYALLATSKLPGAPMAVLNTHTFSQTDFDKVGEVLLAPRPLGILKTGGQPLSALRAAFRRPDDVMLDGPSCVTLHQLADRGRAASYVIQNFNEQAVPVTLTVPLATTSSSHYRDGFTGRDIACDTRESQTGGKLTLEIPPRGRIWVQHVGSPPTRIDAPDRPSGLSEEEAAEGFVPIFDGKSLDGWVGLGGDKSSYYVRDGMLICKVTGKVHIFTEKEYANFILRLQIKLDPGGNNGVGIRTQVNPEPHLFGMETQVLDDDYYKDGAPLTLLDYQHHGSIYGVVPAKTGHLKPAGQWNDEEIICNGTHVTVRLNGAVIVDADLDKVQPLDHKAHPGLQYKQGHISLHAHGNYGAEVFFRNLRVKKLD